MSKKIKPKGKPRMGGAGGLMGGLPAGGGNQAALMAQYQQMQREMVEAQEALGNETVEVSVGGGVVTVVMTGHQRLQELKIDRTKLDLEDEEWVQDLTDLLTAAVNQAIEQSQALSAERMESITGALGGMLPGLG